MGQPRRGTVAAAQQEVATETGRLCRCTAAMPLPQQPRDIGRPFRPVLLLAFEHQLALRLEGLYHFRRDQRTRRLVLRDDVVQQVDQNLFDLPAQIKGMVSTRQERYPSYHHWRVIWHVPSKHLSGLVVIVDPLQLTIVLHEEGQPAIRDIDVDVGAIFPLLFGGDAAA